MVLGHIFPLVHMFFFLRKYFIIGVANYVEITPPDIERKQNKK